MQMLSSRFHRRRKVVHALLYAPTLIETPSRFLASSSRWADHHSILDAALLRGRHEPRTVVAVLLHEKPIAWRGEQARRV